MNRSPFFLLLLVSIIGMIPVNATVVFIPDDAASIQEAINAANHGDTVIVRDGTYTGEGNRNISFLGKSITVRSENGSESTTIDCESASRGFSFHQNETHSSVLQGFTIIHGLASDNNQGGGIYIEDSSPSIIDCQITHCSALEGAGLYVTNSFSRVMDSIIKTNSGAVSGGGISVKGGSPMFQNCQISENSIESYGDSVYGGGLSISDADITLIHCQIIGNEASDGTGSHAFGGGMLIWNSGYHQATLTNCLIESNASINTATGIGAYGGGLCCFSGHVRIQSCTFVNNTAGTNGGPVYAESDADVQLLNCISWNNTPEGIHGASLVKFSDIQGGYSGPGNIDSDPLFTEGTFGGFYLSHIDAGQSMNSPCINAGSIASQNACFSTTTEDHCLDQMTTRSDSQSDTGQLDMGYHYCVNSAEPTPTPSLCTSSGTTLWMPDHEFAGGDQLILKAELCNATPETLVDYKLIVVLMVYDELYFFPEWSPTYSGASFTIEPGLTGMTILDFRLPDELTTVNGLMFISAVMTPDFSDMFGTADIFSFSLKP